MSAKYTISTSEIFFTNAEWGYARPGISKEFWVLLKIPRDENTYNAIQRHIEQKNDHVTATAEVKTNKEVVESLSCLKINMLWRIFEAKSTWWLAPWPWYSANNYRKGSPFYPDPYVCSTHATSIFLPLWKELTEVIFTPSALSILSKTLWHQCFTRPILNHLPTSLPYTSEHCLLRWNNNKQKPASASQLFDSSLEDVDSTIFPVSVSKAQSLASARDM